MIINQIKGLNEEQSKKILEVFESFDNIERVILFGSRAKGNYQPGSDIDCAIYGKDFTLDSLLKLLTKLDDLNFPYKFDLIIYERITDMDIIEHIKRVGIIFYDHKYSKV